MNRLQRASILLALIQKLNRSGSWSGETHIQKATYLLQNLLNVPLDFDFILYKYGPYSFELTDEITSLRADDLLKLIPKVPYGPSISTDESGEIIIERFQETVSQYQDSIEFISNVLGNMSASSVEVLATAYHVTSEHEGDDTEIRSQHIIDLKPHVQKAIALEAVEEIDQIIESAKGIITA